MLETEDKYGFRNELIISVHTHRDQICSSYRSQFSLWFVPAYLGDAQLAGGQLLLILVHLFVAF